MKKVIILALSIIGLLGLSVYTINSKATEVNVVDSEKYNNVGNGEEYQYKITNINGDEITGVPLNKESEDNKGIVLYTDELSFAVQVGDKIAVVWGEYEDQFESIKKIN